MADSDWLTRSGPWQFAAYNWPEDAGGPTQWWRYAYGFREAADRLVDSILDGRRGQLDLLLPPILFLYRHYIELSLKAAIKSLEEWLGDSVIHPRKQHDIAERWQLAFQLVAEVSGPAPDFSEATAVVRELARHDPGSTSFRYPEELRGGRTAPELEWVNIATLKEAMEHVAQALSFVEGTIDLMNSAR